MNTFESLAESTRVLISAAVWSAVALVSIPSNFVPSVAISLPSTVPPTVILFVTSKDWVYVPLHDFAVEPRS